MPVTVMSSFFRFPPAFFDALKQFNAGDYFACHETLEELWIPETDSIREVYQGVLHVAVACYHLSERANWHGAERQLERAIRRLTPWVPLIESVDLARLQSDCRRLRSHLHALGPAQVHKYDPAWLPHIAFTEPTV
jgi:predicted metal-dependent hydrolase